MEQSTTYFLKVLEANKGILYKVVNSYCRDHADRKDLMQEIILQLWLSLHRYDETYKISTWVYRIALNVSISFYRKQVRRVDISHQLPDEIIFLPEQPEEGFTSHEVENVYKFIRNLKEFDRALMLLYLDGKSTREMATVTGLSETNITSRLSRIRQRMKTELNKQKV